MKLGHLLSEQQSQFLTEPSQIKQWLDQHKIHNYTINEDASVSVAGDVTFVGVLPELQFQVQFRTVTGNFYVEGKSLKTLLGCPQIVGGNFDCAYCDLVDLTHISTKIGGTIFCNGNPIKTFKNIHKMTSCNKVLLPMNNTPGTLYWILVPNIRTISCFEEQVGEILTTHIRTKDILACQEDLIDAGFGAWAKL